MKLVRFYDSRLSEEDLNRQFFDEKSAELIFKTAKLPKGWYSKRKPDYYDIASKLNEAAFSYWVHQRQARQCTIAEPDQR